MLETTMCASFGSPPDSGMLLSYSPKPISFTAEGGSTIYFPSTGGWTYPMGDNSWIPHPGTMPYTGKPYPWGQPYPLGTGTGDTLKIDWEELRRTMEAMNPPKAPEPPKETMVTFVVRQASRYAFEGIHPVCSGPQPVCECGKDAFTILEAQQVQVRRITYHNGLMTYEVSEIFLPVLECECGYTCYHLYLMS